MSDLPSQDTGTFRQVLNIPALRDSMPVSSSSVLGLNKVAQQQEFSPKGPLAMLQVSPSLKEAIDKFKQDFKAANLPEGKFIKPTPSATKW